jgi:hypothetical protein
VNIDYQQHKKAASQEGVGPALGGVAMFLHDVASARQRLLVQDWQHSCPCSQRSTIGRGDGVALPADEQCRSHVCAL